MNAEKRTALVDLIESSGYPVLIEVIEELVLSEVQKLQAYDLRTGKTDILVYLKCEADGAKKLAHSLQRRLAALKAEANQ